MNIRPLTEDCREWAISSLTVGLRLSSATETRLRNGSSSWLSAGIALCVKIVAPGRVDADGQVVQHQLLDVPGQVVGDVPVGQDLVVGDEHEHLHAEVLQADPVVEGAEVVAQMQTAGRTVPGQHAEPSWLLADQSLQHRAAGPRGGGPERVAGAASGSASASARRVP